MKTIRVALFSLSVVAGVMLVFYFALTTTHPRGLDWTAFGTSRFYALQVTGSGVADIPGGPVYGYRLGTDGRIHRTIVGYCIRVGRLEALTGPAGPMYLVQQPRIAPSH